MLGKPDPHAARKENQGKRSNQKLKNYDCDNCQRGQLGARFVVHSSSLR
jgi:hypothetical protein